MVHLRTILRIFLASVGELLIMASATTIAILVTNKTSLNIILIWSLWIGCFIVLGVTLRIFDDQLSIKLTKKNRS